MFYTINIKKIKRFILFTFLLCIFIVFIMVSLKYIRFFKYVDLINEYSAMYGLDPTFVSAIIEQESKFKKNAVSHKGASGLMQITEETAVWLAELNGMEKFDYSDIFDPETNIALGTFYLSKLYDDYDGNMEFVMIAYNAGSGTLYKWRNDPKYSKDGTTIDYIPYPETEKYIKKVTRKQKKYKIIYEVFNL